MKKYLSIIAIFSLLSFAFVVSVDAFFCDENNQVSKSAQAPVHCCVQCCPAHNLITPSSGIAQILPSLFINSFVIENLDIKIEIHPSRIERPPIV